MTKGLAVTLDSFLATELAAPYIDQLRAGDRATGELVLKAFGHPATDKNLAELFDLAGKVKNPNDLADDLARKARGLMSLNPQDLAIRGIVAGGTELMHGLGDAAENNGNSLAAAIMAANRTNSAKQNEIYGPSRREKYAEAWGQERMRRGKNASRALHGIANVADKVFGMYNNADLAGRTLAASTLTGNKMPATTWDYLGRNVTANKK